MAGDPNIDTLEGVNASAMPARETPTKAWRCRDIAIGLTLSQTGPASLKFRSFEIVGSRWSLIQ